MTILEMQEVIQEKGYQWEEHVFNDRNPSNCYVCFTMDTDPHYFSNHPIGDKGWGRFNRQWAWEQAYDVLVHGRKSE